MRAKTRMFCFILIVTMLLGTLAACGGESGDTSASTTQTSSKATETSNSIKDASDKATQPTSKPATDAAPTEATPAQTEEKTTAEKETLPAGYLKSAWVVKDVPKPSAFEYEVHETTIANPLTGEDTYHYTVSCPSTFTVENAMKAIEKTSVIKDLYEFEVLTEQVVEPQWTPIINHWLTDAYDMADLINKKVLDHAEETVSLRGISKEWLAENRTAYGLYDVASFEIEFVHDDIETHEGYNEVKIWISVEELDKETVGKLQDDCVTILTELIGKDKAEYLCFSPELEEMGSEIGNDRYRRNAGDADYPDMLWLVYRFDGSVIEGYESSVMSYRQYYVPDDFKVLQPTRLLSDLFNTCLKGSYTESDLEVCSYARELVEGIGCFDEERAATDLIPYYTKIRTSVKENDGVKTTQGKLDTNFIIGILTPEIEFKVVQDAAGEVKYFRVDITGTAGELTRTKTESDVAAVKRLQDEVVKAVNMILPDLDTSFVDPSEITYEKVSDESAYSVKASKSETLSLNGRDCEIWCLIEVEGLSKHASRLTGKYRLQIMFDPEGIW